MEYWYPDDSHEGFQQWNDKPILIDDGTLDYVIQLPSGRVERFNREYVLDTYGDCCYATLAEQLAREIE